MVLRRPKPDVLIVPPGIVLELFALARFAGRVGLPVESLKMFLALRRMRPDVPEFSSYPAMLLMEGSRFDEAKKMLEEYLSSGFDDCSLVRSLLAYLYYNEHNPVWVMHAGRSRDVAEQDGGGSYQREVLASLPLEVLDRH